MLLFLNVIYVLIAIAMIALILMQRGAGAQAGSGFGGGASSTVFGSRGASNFLSKSTKWLAIVFFAISLFMAWRATDRASDGVDMQDMGVMSQVPVAPAGDAEVPALDGAVPAVPAQAAPAADSEVPAVPAQPQPVENESTESSSAPSAN
jgi:preprotein translocase subunit SecG